MVLIIVTGFTGPLTGSVSPVMISGAKLSCTISERMLPGELRREKRSLRTCVVDATGSSFLFKRRNCLSLDDLTRIHPYFVRPSLLKYICFIQLKFAE